MKKSLSTKALLFFILLCGLALPAPAQRLKEIEENIKNPPPHDAHLREFHLRNFHLQNLTAITKPAD